MTRWASLLVSTLLTPGALAAAPAPECRPDAPGVRAIRAVATGIVDADNRRDIERVLAYYAADAVLMPPGEAPVVGRDAIRPRYEALFAGFNPAIEPEIAEACGTAGLGFVRGRNAGRLVPRASAEARALDDVFVMLLRREMDGVWRISHLIWHRQSEAVAVPSEKGETAGRAPVVQPQKTAGAPALDHDTPPRPKRITKPQYPKDAFDKKIEGTVEIEILINAEGGVADARIVQSVPGLDEAALKCVKQWRFEPARKDGKPVATVARAPVTFRISPP